jgi:hypothetical protein
MSKLNLKSVKDVKVYFNVERSKGNMPDFIVNNWRKMHHKPMHRKVQRKRVKLSNKMAKHM